MGISDGPVREEGSDRAWFVGGVQLGIGGHGVNIVVVAVVVVESGEGLQCRRDFSI